MSNKIVIEVTEDDRVFVESVCEKSHQTFSALFKYMLDEYRKKYGYKKNCKSAEQEFQHLEESSESDDPVDDKPENDSLQPVKKKNKK